MDGLSEPATDNIRFDIEHSCSKQPVEQRRLLWLTAAVAEAKGGSGRPNAGSEMVAADSAMTTVVNRVPRAARWLIPAWAAAFRGTDASTVEPRTRLLLLLRVAAVDRSAYWRVQLERSAREVGVTPDEVRIVESDEWETTPGFTDRERAAILWGDRVARRLARRDARAYESLRTAFTQDELVELTLVAALAAMADRFTNALRIAPESPIGLSPSNVPVPEAAMAAWVGR
jgi:alkylhydroperoxidase family enzyme